MEPVRADASAVEPPAPSSTGFGPRTAELVAAAAVFALGLGALGGALGLGFWTRGPGPGFFPLWLGVLLVLLAAVWAGQVVRGKNVHEPEPIPSGGRRAVALVLGALLVAILLLDVVGYQLSMTALVLFVLVAVGRRGWFSSIVVALAAGVGIYALFANVLQVYLPTAGVPFLTQMGL